jgi:phage tail sheath protein FI
MATQLSPGVNVTEIDLTTVVPAVSTSIGGLAGLFQWGPVGDRVTVSSETDLVTRFGKPSNMNAETWFTAANFLGYTNNLIVVRAANTTGTTPSVSANTTANNINSNNVFNASNTTQLSVGMYLTQIGNTALYNPASSNVTITAVNSTSFTLSSNTTSNTTTTFYFANPNTSYTALGLASPTAVVANLVNQIVVDQNAYLSKAGTFDTSVLYLAKYPGGNYGNSLRVSVCDTANAYSDVITLSNAAFTNVSTTFTTGSNVVSVSMQNAGNTTSNAALTGALALLATNDYIQAGNSSIGTQYCQVASVSNVSTNSTSSVATINLVEPYRLALNYSSATISRYWEFFNLIGTAPGQSQYVKTYGNTAAQDELHVVVVDDNGAFTGVPGTILETYQGLSRATDAKNADGTNNYYANVINQDSSYIWWTNDRSNSTSANAFNVASSTNYAPLTMPFVLGNDGMTEATVDLGTIGTAYNQFVSKEDVDVDIIMQGKAIGGTTVSGGVTVNNYLLANYLIQNLALQREDLIVTMSPDIATVVNNRGNEAASLVAWRNVVQSTSYAVMDSGYKYQYDKYSDLYRWIPMNGDVAGLMARTDQTNAAWWSPAGFNRGLINNVVRLAFNPNKTARDNLYSVNVNPIVTFPGQGTLLFGDKTLQAKPSAFDRINVRRLFLVLEKAISTAAKYSLFEFNDDFTRRQFVNLVTPYLTGVKGARGITDFVVVCDTTNNTPQVIDTNQFVGDIYIKPARSINFIQLNFVAVPTGVQFSEVVGKF